MATTKFRELREIVAPTPRFRSDWYECCNRYRMTCPNDSVSLDQLHEAALIIDPPENRILYANPAACALLHRDAGQLGATSVSALFGDELPELVAFTQSVMATGRAWTNRLGCRRGAGERL